MDGLRFDALSRKLAAPASRRGLSRLLPGLILAEPLTLLGLVPTEARHKKHKKKHHHSASSPPPSPPPPASPPPPCPPTCPGRTGGEDGCGGRCGDCPSGQLCRQGQCHGPGNQRDCHGQSLQATQCCTDADCPIVAYCCSAHACLDVGFCCTNADCGSGSSCCPGAGGGHLCIDTSDDPNNCGGCGQLCPTGNCQGGRCDCGQGSR